MKKNDSSVDIKQNDLEDQGSKESKTDNKTLNASPNKKLTPQKQSTSKKREQK